VKIKLKQGVRGGSCVFLKYNTHGIEMPHVRLANPQDEDEIVAMLDAVADQWGVRAIDGGSFPFSERKAREFVSGALAQRNSWIGVVTGETGTLEASICIMLNEPFFSHGSFLAEVWTVVLPEYRNSHNVKHLIEFAKSFAEAASLPLVFGVVAHDRVKVKQRLFDMIVGQPPSGNFYVYRHPKNDVSAHGAN